MRMPLQAFVVSATTGDFMLPVVTSQTVARARWVR